MESDILLEHLKFEPGPFDFILTRLFGLLAFFVYAVDVSERLCLVEIRDLRSACVNVVQFCLGLEKHNVQLL